MELTFDIEYKGEIFSVEADVTDTVDHNYGADADGNRGWTEVFREVDYLCVYNEEGEQVKKLPKDLEESILDMIDEMDGEDDSEPEYNTEEEM